MLCFRRAAGQSIPTRKLLQDLCGELDVRYYPSPDSPINLVYTPAILEAFSWSGVIVLTTKKKAGHQTISGPNAE